MKVLFVSDEDSHEADRREVMSRWAALLNENYIDSRRIILRSTTPLSIADWRTSGFEALRGPIIANATGTAEQHVEAYLANNGYTNAGDDQWQNAQGVTAAFNRVEQAGFQLHYFSNGTQFFTEDFDLLGNRVIRSYYQNNQIVWQTIFDYEGNEVLRLQFGDDGKLRVAIVLDELQHEVLQNEQGVMAYMLRHNVDAETLVISDITEVPHSIVLCQAIQQAGAKLLFWGNGPLKIAEKLMGNDVAVVNPKFANVMRQATLYGGVIVPSVRRRRQLAKMSETLQGYVMPEGWLSESSIREFPVVHPGEKEAGLFVTKIAGEATFRGILKMVRKVREHIRYVKVMVLVADDETRLAMQKILMQTDLVRNVVVVANQADEYQRRQLQISEGVLVLERNTGMFKWLLEAQLSGTPIFGFANANGIEEFAHVGDGVILMDKPNYDKLAAEILGVITDPNRLLQMESRAKKAALEFSNKGLVAKWQLLIDEVMK